MTSSTRAHARWKFLFVIALSSILAIASTPLMSSQNADASAGGYRFKKAERCLMRKINRIRVRHGLRRFERDKQLAYVARRHAVDMSANGGVYHDPNVSWKVTRWRRLGENTGRGRSCRSLTRSFMNSYSHRKHILGRFRFMGIGTQKRDGKLYVQQLFESRRNPGNVYHYP